MVNGGVMKFKSLDELLLFTEDIVGKKFKEIDKKGLLLNKKDKGVLGKIVETGFYGYDINNNSEADFAELGVELKVTGYKNIKRGISAKERLVLSKINYSNIINEKFDSSKVLFKNKKLLIIWYQYSHEHKSNYGEFKIKCFQLYDMGIDMDIFENDFNIIKSAVKDGNAHLLSEGDTSYLGACIKGSSSKDRVKQPNSDIMAKPRAFSLKNSYMTGLLRSIGSETIVPSTFKTAHNYVYSKFKPYFGLNQLEISKKLGMDINPEKVPKDMNKQISNKIIGKDKDLKNIDDVFNKTNYQIKNLPVDGNLRPIERLSFRNLNLLEFDEEWEDSDWKIYFEEITLILILYNGKINGRKLPNGYRILNDVKSVSFTEDNLNMFKRSYEMVQSAINSQDLSLLPYPNSYENQALVIAPRGVKGDKGYDTFFDKNGTKTCFMMNKDFVYDNLID
jgi:DNA mismatch repair protein MutH